jgi:hypothetical protein
MEAFAMTAMPHAASGAVSIWLTRRIIKPPGRHLRQSDWGRPHWGSKKRFLCFGQPF